MSETSRRLRIGVIGVPGGWSSEQLADAVEAKTGFRCLIDLARVSLDLAEGRVLFGDHDLAAFDALMVKKLGPAYGPDLLDRLEILHFLDQRGVRVFSKPAAMMRLLDRLSCTTMLRAGGIPMPPTIVTEDVDAAFDAIDRFGQAILKPLYSSKARGMRMVAAGPDARGQVQAFRDGGNPVLYIQKLVRLPGSDLGVVFLGGEYLACYARGARDFSRGACTENCGQYQSCKPSQDVIELANRAQALFRLDFTCVDVAETPDGPMVFEVSAFGGFRGLKAACGMDAATMYVEHVMRKLDHGC